MMSRVRSTDTTPELTIRRLTHAKGLRFRKHDRKLPGRPDMVFVAKRVVVFVDGDFWHGWRFPVWSHKLTPYWKEKIKGNRARDRKNFQRLRTDGWIVIRLWEHQIERDAENCVETIRRVLQNRPNRRPGWRDLGKRAAVAIDSLSCSPAHRSGSFAHFELARAMRSLPRPPAPLIGGCLLQTSALDQPTSPRGRPSRLRRRRSAMRSSPVTYKRGH